MASQIEGLIGAGGILPLQELLAPIADWYGGQKYWYFPTVFWMDASNSALRTVCFAGVAASVLVTLNLFTRATLVVCFVLYLSITTVGQDFTAFQWDVFLLESGFLAIFLPWNAKVIPFLYRVLIARFMFMGGVVKIASGDPTWRDLTALVYHYWTQPLPSPLGYYAYFLPEWWHKLCTGCVLFIELIVPFFAFMPRPFRLFAAWCFILLQTSILLTGNYNFFNLLALLLCLFLFDDVELAKITPHGLTSRLQQNDIPATALAESCASLWAVIVAVILGTHVWIAQSHKQPVGALRQLLQAASAFGVVNNYGPFAVMTTQRDEIIVEGSEDGVNWLAYRFNYKPDALDKRLSWNVPHQPRLDWQMWFAALSPPESGGWFEKFMRRLSEGSPAVTALLADNPFPNQPPHFLKAYLYRYTFTSLEERKSTGKIWRRELKGLYYMTKAVDGLTDVVPSK